MTPQDIKMLFATLNDRFEKEKEYLGDLDAVLGDGDHGVSMAKGFTKAYEAVKDNNSEDVGKLFQAAGRALMSGIGGASGPLFAMVLLELGKASLGKTEFGVGAFKKAVSNSGAAVQRLGKAEAGDKTMLDVLFPVADSLESISNLKEGLEQASKTATDAAEKTAEMPAKKGRAQYVQNAGVGHPDPGATSLAIFFETFYQVYTQAGVTT